MDINIEEWETHELHEYISMSIKQNKPVEVLNVNIHAMNLIYKDSNLFQILKTADSVFCDGEGVRIAANMKGAQIPYKITYADWMLQFFPFCEKMGYKIFFLGSTSDILEKAVQRVQKDYPKVEICGYMNGFEDYDHIKASIVETSPEIVLLGMGMPLQEKVIRKLKLENVSSVYLSGGAVFDYVSQEVRRAPAWMIQLKLEWLFRFLLEPKRLFVRYFIGNPLFYWRVWTNQTPKV